MYTSDYLCHYGTKGMRWYVRRYQNSDGSLTPEGRRRYLKERKFLTANTDYYKDQPDDWFERNDVKYNDAMHDWGNFEDTNVLYVTGRSGSGKSILALSLAELEKDSEFIMLDFYTYGNYSDPNSKDWQNKDFNKYLDKNVPNWRKLHTIEFEKTDEFEPTMKQFASAIEGYGKEQFNNGKKSNM